MEIKAPLLPESVADATVASWHKSIGDSVTEGEVICELETDKVMLEVPALSDGVITEIIKPEGSTVVADELIGKIESSAATKVSGVSASSKDTNKVTESKDAMPSLKNSETQKSKAVEAESSLSESVPPQSPSTRKMMLEHNLTSDQIKGTGKSGRITKEDIETHIAKSASSSASSSITKIDLTSASVDQENTATGSRHTERVAMTRMRTTIAARLLQSQQNTASLTTFNEVDLTQVMTLRKEYKEGFEKKYGIKLGFMSFFTKACCTALKLFPEVNASIDGSDIIYHNYCDIGVAVSTEKGLVVPVVRNAESLAMHEIEKSIAMYANKAREGRLTLDEMTGGTFSITNGGTFGSMLSTPILNIPQSAILGMHNIIKRPMVVDGEIQIRPMMYLALTYDHRIIDGSQSVRFLVTVKQLLEDPARLLLDI
ncbi:MAG: 2-oxoglutarate dehydrogenase complex dihydrolipoyllysine-residue succinyltransferase [Pseudomonadota bacterium]|nr:2-oxoglutarate dehydrogenase complex dihydrolipoyllysine-residue succinyltransferase [Pseudomonadota bacterium]